jgi:hypothetical protein
MLLCELRIPLPFAPAVWCDNVSALALASNPVYHARTKHIEVDYHFVHEKVLNKDISLAFISTAEQIVDIFTKGLSTARFQFLQSKLTVTPFPVSLREDVKPHAQAHLADTSDEDRPAVTQHQASVSHAITGSRPNQEKPAYHAVSRHNPATSHTAANHAALYSACQSIQRDAKGKILLAANHSLIRASKGNSTRQELASPTILCPPRLSDYFSTTT